MPNTLISKHFTIPLLLALLVSVLPAEATRRHSIRPQVVVPPEMVAEDSVTEAAAGMVASGELEAASEPEMTTNKDAPAPRRGLLEILFGRAAAEALAPEEAGVEMDGRMFDAVRLAERSARSHSIHRCWRYVKRALQAAGVVDGYPRTAYAKQAAEELPERYGFKEIEVTDPFDAPVGSVLVYGGRGAGHVELRTEKGFVSDHASLKPSPRPLIGVFVKPSEG
jgi:hypothetical protein